MLSYTTLALTTTEADAYATARGYTAWAGDTAAKTAALFRGQTYIAATYNGQWLTEWPNNDAPENVKFAIIEAAMRDIVTPGSLMPDYTPGKVVKRERVKAGPVESEQEYAETGAVPLPVFSIIDMLLVGFVRTLYRSGLGIWSVG